MIVLSNASLEIVYFGPKLREVTELIAESEPKSLRVFGSNKRLKRENGLTAATVRVNGELRVLCVFPEAASKTIRFGLHQTKNGADIVYMHEYSKKKVRLAAEGNLSPSGKTPDQFKVDFGASLDRYPSLRRSKVNTVETFRAPPAPQFGPEVEVPERSFVGNRREAHGNGNQSTKRFTGLHVWTDKEVRNFAEKHGLTEDEARELIDNLGKKGN